VTEVVGPRDADDVVFDGDRPFGPGAPHVVRELVDRWVVARSEEPRVVDEDDVVPHRVTEDVSKLGTDRCVGGASG
jgi:hypothetical protein